MSRIRVLVVDDSAVVRRVVGEVLSADPAIEVAGAAANGRIALAMLEREPADLVTLDVTMPEMDGLQTLAAIRRSHPRLPVIMYSATTERGAAVTLEALMLGANDYVTKPEKTSGPGDAARHVQVALLPKIKALSALGSRLSAPVVEQTSPDGEPSGASITKAIAPNRDRASLSARDGGRRSDRDSEPVSEPRAESREPRASAQHPPPRIIVIGASTGGPSALAALLPALPREFPLPIVVVQHMPPMFTGLLAANLATRAALRVRELVHGGSPEPGTVWIAPGDGHVHLERGEGRIAMRVDPRIEQRGHTAVDALFRSAAQVYGDGVLALVLTGMGQDGLRGCEAIRRAGGRILVQDRVSSVVWGMPGAVAREGLADAVLPLDALADELLSRVMAERDVADL